MKPRPQGAFPWLWRWDSKAREKSPGNEVGESRLSIGHGQQLCQDECKKQVFSSNCNVSFKVLSDVLAATTEQHYWLWADHEKRKFKLTQSLIQQQIFSYLVGIDIIRGKK